MTIDLQPDTLTAKEIRAIQCEMLQDEIMTLPPGVEMLCKNNICEEWVVYTAMGSIPLVFYFNGQAVVNTAPYSADTLTWIAAKAKLMEVMRSE